MFFYLFIKQGVKEEGIRTVLLEVGTAVEAAAAEVEVEPFSARVNRRKRSANPGRLSPIIRFSNWRNDSYTKNTFLPQTEMR